MDRVMGKSAASIRKIGKWHPRLIVKALIFVCFTIFAVSAGQVVNANTFNVNSTNDAVDANPGNGVCETFPGSGLCTIRAAIEESNALVGDDIVNLQAGVYDIRGLFGGFIITDNLIINGAGAKETLFIGGEPIFDGDGVFIDDGHDGTIFNVECCPIVEINGVTINGGGSNPASGRGGGILNNGNLEINDCLITHNGGSFPTNSVVKGGGIFNNNDLVVNNCTFSHNYVIGGEELEGNDSGPPEKGQGGAIYNSGIYVMINNSVFYGNKARLNAGQGGAIYNIGSDIVISNSTFFDNTATELGGTIYNKRGRFVTDGEVEIKNSTISGKGDFEKFEVNGIFNNGSLRVGNTIIEGIEGADCTGSISSSGNNIFDVSTSVGCDISLTRPNGFDAKNIIVDPGLGAFVDSTIPGRAHFPLLPSSPAIDAGNNALCPVTDQLGNFRPVDGKGDNIAICDIGAIEFFTVGNVNDYLSERPVTNSSSFDPTPVANGPAGKFSFEADFCNISTDTLINLKSETIELTNDNVLLNRDAGPPLGVGSVRTFPLDNELSDSLLEPGECATIRYEIGLTTTDQFRFLVDVFGDVK